MKYREKYLKYKQKYLNLKNNNFKGGYINEYLIDKFNICEFHGSLEVDDTFVVPKNIYIIQSNMCSIGNTQTIIDLFTKLNSYETKTYREILDDFNYNQQYTIIKPNTEICNVKLGGNFYDFSVLGIFNFKPALNYFDNIVYSSDDNIIKDKINIFMDLYKTDYESNMKILKQKYNFDIIKQFKIIQFDFKYLIGFIDYIKHNVKPVNKKGILKIDDYDRYNELLTPDKIQDIQLFDTIMNILLDKNTINIIQNIKIHTDRIKVLPDIQNYDRFEYHFIDKKNNFTYFQVFMMIFSSLFLNYFNIPTYETNLKDEILKLSANTKPYQISIFFNASCLSTQEKDVHKIEICQLKLSDKNKLDVLFKKINPELTIYNILFNDIDTIYHHINIVLPFTYKQNMYDLYSSNNLKTYLLPLIIIIEITFFTTSIDTLMVIIEEYKYLNYNNIDPNDFIKEKFPNFKLYELIFKIFFEFKNKNIMNKIYKMFYDVFEIINDFIDNNNDAEFDTELNKIYDVIKTFPLESQKYNELQNIIFYSINYFYINTILDLEKTYETESRDKLEYNVILDINKTNDIINIKIKNEYLRNGLTNVSLNLYKLNDIKFDVINYTLIKSSDTPRVDKDNIYEQTLIELFDMYYNL
jgi:hypothetical protein